MYGHIVDNRYSSPRGRTILGTMIGNGPPYFQFSVNQISARKENLVERALNQLYSLVKKLNEWLNVNLNGIRQFETRSIIGSLCCI